MKKRLNENCIDILRLLAALQVALTHYLNLTLLHFRQEGWEDTFLLGIKRVLTLFPGVVILFSISGFLMGASMERTPKRTEFLKKRARRIYPALWAAMLFMLLPPLLFMPQIGQDWAGYIKWFLIQMTGVAYTPDFLKGFGAGSINGALWTVMVEVQFYILLAIFWNYIKRSPDWCWHFIVPAAFCINLAMDFAAAAAPEAMWIKLLDRTVLPYLCWFAAGMYCYRFREKMLPALWKALPAAGIFYVIYKGCYQMSGWQIPGYYADCVTSLVLPFLTVGVAYAFGTHRLKRDISYGIFLYHWPLINVVFALRLPERIDHIVLFAGYTLCFIALALASWELLEAKLIRKEAV